MRDELFPVEQVSGDSPRLRWIKQHRISTVHNSDVPPGTEDELSGETIYPWCAFIGEPRFPRPDAGYGNTEDEAVSDLAHRKGIPLWMCSGEKLK